MSLELNSNNIEYKDNKVIIKSIPKEGENLSVFLRPGDEVVFDIEGVDSDQLNYALVGGDIVVEFPQFGSLTFPSLGLMSFSSNPPSFNFGGSQAVSVEAILSNIQEINELPISSVDASFTVRVSDTDEDRSLMHSKSDETPKPTVIVIPQSQVSQEAYTKENDYTQILNENENTYVSAQLQEIPAKSNAIPSIYTNQYQHYTKVNDFNAYKPDVEMIPKPDVEMIPKPDVEMIPKPDVEMIPKPDEEMMPKNDFTDYFPENDFTGYGNGDGEGDGNVDDAAKPVFYFKATAHQVRYGEILNDEGQYEILGGGGSINGYKFDSVTNQFEPETIDISARTEDIVVRSENSTYFSSQTGRNNALTFKDLIEGQSVTVDGLKLTATGDIAAADVAAGFASLAAGASSGNNVTNGAWSGNLSDGWSSGTATAADVTFTSTAGNSDVSVFNVTSSGMNTAAPAALVIIPIQGNGTTTETHELTFQDLTEGQSVTVDGLKLTATGNIAAADVAAGFASLTASATEGNALSNGVWSGTLSADWSSGAAAGTAVTFTSQTATTDVADIAASSSGITVAAPTDVDVTTSENVLNTYLSRVLRFEPQMPEGFYLESFSISGLPAGVDILDKNADAVSGTTVSRDDMILKNALGEIISYESEGFITDFKSAEFTIRYSNTITSPFNVSITANYKLDDAYSETTDIEPEQSYTGEYTFALKDITSADDYTYEKEDFANSKDEGFILAKEVNYNIIKDGSGNNVLYGGKVKDVVYDDAGDDIYYLGGSEDTLYGGSGTNRIYGDLPSDEAGVLSYEAEDTISYENVRSFGLSEVELLSQEGIISSQESQMLSGTYDEDGDPDTDNSISIDMLSSYKGVYVDLDGVHIDGLNIDVNGDEVIDENDKINALSKFAEKDGRFTYDDDGYAIDTTLAKTITFTSTTPNAQVDDIVVYNVQDAQAVDAPANITLTSVQGNATTTETHKLTFQDLVEGQSVTVDGLKLTATGNIAASDVAAGFTSLAAGAATGNAVANGIWSGTLSADWSSGAATGAAVTFTSQTPTANVADITTISQGRSEVQGVTDVGITIEQGSDLLDTKQSEKAVLVFRDLAQGESVTVGGLTLSATTGAINAAAIAAGFASLAAGATEGNPVLNGAWSGALSGYSSGEQEVGLNGIQSMGYDIYEGIENVTGSIYNDTIYANAALDNTISGLGGSDIIDARGGNNKIYGGDGGDTLISGSGKDFIDGGADTDTISYVNMSESVTVRLDRPNAEEYDYSLITSSGETKDRIENVENVTGSGHDDIIYGNSSTNFIQGGDGDDKIYAGGGYDFIDGGSGSDWITYYRPDYDSNSTNPNFMQDIQGITVDLNSSDFVMVKETATDSLIDLVKSVEQIRATDGIDRIYGSNSASEIIWGLGGNDTIYGRNGNDVIYGGSGDDIIRPGGGVDESHGGSGVDYLELYDDGLKNSTVQIIRLSEDGTVQHSTDNGTTWIDGYIAGSGAGTVETADGFEGVGLSNRGDDILYGNDGDNVLNTYGGDDTIYGKDGNDAIRAGDGDDIVYGGAGDDTIYGDRNNDTIDAGEGDDTVYGYGRYNTNVSNNDKIDGGDGIDTLDYNQTSDAITLDMSTVDGDGYATVEFLSATGDAGIYDDLVKNFERIIGSRGSDTITANDSGMMLDGWSGTDKLYGGAGDDTVIARNTSGEILSGGAGDDTLSLVQNVNFRNITVSGFETLELGNYQAYFNLSQLALNQFDTITGGDNSRLYIYAANNSDNDTFDLSNIDFSAFSGSLYIYGYNGNDTYDFTNATFNANMNFYLDAGGGTDTLVMGANQSINMLDNYYNTFEDFDMGASSQLNVNAYNNNGRSFYAHNKDFDDVDADADINLIGGSGNDTFYANYEALLEGKLNIEGALGTDVVDVRTATTNGTLTFDNPDIFGNIERLELDQIDASNMITMDATAMDDWLSSDNLTLDLANNNTQSNKVQITDTQATPATMTDFMVSTEYTVTPIDNDSFAMQVV